VSPRFVLVAFATLVLSVWVGTASAAAAVGEPARVLFGATRLELSAEFLQALASARISIGSTRPGTYQSGGLGPYLAFPIPAGQVDPDATVLSLSHRGGVDLRVADRAVALRDLVIERRGPRTAVMARLAGRSIAVDRMPLFDVLVADSLGLEAAAVPTGPSRLTVAAAPLLLSDAAADRLNEALGVDVFHGDMSVGTAHISVYLASVAADPAPAG
jgi:hypothetical protein